MTHNTYVHYAGTSKLQQINGLTCHAVTVLVDLDFCWTLFGHAFAMLYTGSVLTIIYVRRRHIIFLFAHFVTVYINFPDTVYIQISERWGP